MVRMMMMKSHMAVAVEDRLRDHAAFFDHILSLVDPKYYINNEDSAAAPNKYMKNKKQQKTAPDHKKDRRLNKFDPDQQKSIAELQREAKQKADEEENNDDDDDEDDEDDEDEDGDEEEEDEEDGEEEEEEDAEASNEPAAPIFQEHLSGEKSSLDELRAKLQSRVQQLRANRKKDDGHDLSREKLKQRRLEKKAKKKKQKKQKAAQAAAGATPAAHPFQPRQIPSLVDEEDEPSTVRFSKFEFGNMAAQQQPVKKIDKYGALKKAEARQAKLSKIKEVDQEKAKHIEESMEWKAALQRAEGIKVKDDTALLRKSVKRDEKQKMKSKAQWDERITHEKDQQKMRQKRRTENIQARIAQKGQKQKKSPKKQRAGFEGKKSGFGGKKKGKQSSPAGKK